MRLTLNVVMQNDGDIVDVILLYVSFIPVLQVPRRAQDNLESLIQEQSVDAA